MFFFLSVIPSLGVFFLITFTTNEILPSATSAAEWLTGSTGMNIFRDSFAAVLKRLNWLGMTLLVCNSLVRKEMLRNVTATVYYRSQPPPPPSPKRSKFIPFWIKNFILYVNTYLRMHFTCKYLFDDWSHRNSFKILFSEGTSSFNWIYRQRVQIYEWKISVSGQHSRCYPLMSRVDFEMGSLRNFIGGKHSLLEVIWPKRSQYERFGKDSSYVKSGSYTEYVWPVFMTSVDCKTDGFFLKIS